MARQFVIIIGLCLTAKSIAFMRNHNRASLHYKPMCTSLPYAIKCTDYYLPENNEDQLTSRNMPNDGQPHQSKRHTDANSDRLRNSSEQNQNYNYEDDKQQLYRKYLNNQARNAMPLKDTTNTPQQPKEGHSIDSTLKTYHAQLSQSLPYSTTKEQQLQSMIKVLLSGQMEMQKQVQMLKKQLQDKTINKSSQQVAISGGTQNAMKHGKPQQVTPFYQNTQKMKSNTINEWSKRPITAYQTPCVKNRYPGMSWKSNTLTRGNRKDRNTVTKLNKSKKDSKSPQKSASLSQSQTVECYNQQKVSYSNTQPNSRINTPLNSHRQRGQSNITPRAQITPKVQSKRNNNTLSVSLVNNCKQNNTEGLNQINRVSDNSGPINRDKTYKDQSCLISAGTKNKQAIFPVMSVDKYLASVKSKKDETVVFVTEAGQSAIWNDVHAYLVQANRDEEAKPNHRNGKYQQHHFMNTYFLQAKLREQVIQRAMALHK